MFQSLNKRLIIVQTTILMVLVYAAPADAQIRERCTVANKLKGPVYLGLGELKGTVALVGLAIALICGLGLIIFAMHSRHRSNAMQGLVWALAALLLVASIPGIAIALSGSRCI